MFQVERSSLCDDDLLRPGHLTRESHSARTESGQVVQTGSVPSSLVFKNY